jgi:hypothetical protein
VGIGMSKFPFFILALFLSSLVDKYIDLISDRLIWLKIGKDGDLLRQWRKGMAEEWDG